MYESNYSSVLGCFYTDIRMKKNDEAKYFADLQKKQIEQLALMNQQLALNNTYIDPDPLFTEDDIDKDPSEFDTWEEYRQYIKHTIGRHRRELKDYQDTLKNVERIIKLRRQLRNFKPKGFFESIKRKHAIKKELKQLYKTGCYEFTSDADLASFKQDLINGVKIWTKLVEDDKKIIAHKKES